MAARPRTNPLRGFVCPIIRGALGPGAEHLVIGSGLARSLGDYCRRASLHVVAVAAILGVLGYIVLPRLSRGLIPSPLALVVGVLAGLGLSLAFTVFRVLVSYSSRGDYLEAKFHAYASTLALLLAGGAGVAEAFRALANYKDELRDFLPEIEYMNNMISLGYSVDKALEGLAEMTPSRSIKGLALALSNAVVVGADVAGIVQRHLSEYSSYQYSLVERISATVGILMEAFLVIGMMTPVLVSMVIMLLLAYPVRGLSVTSLVVLVAFIMVPLLSAMVVILIDNQLSKVRP